MTQAPGYVAVKRKRDEPPIQSLILEERQAKHVRLNVEYRLDSVSQTSNEPPPKLSKLSSRKKQAPDNADQSVNATSLSDSNSSSTSRPLHPVKHAGPRHFELATGKRSAETAGLLPTFIERPLKRAHLDQTNTPSQTEPSANLKRPGTKRTAQTAGHGSKPTKVLGKGPEPSAALSEKLHSFALEETAEDREEEQEHIKPRVIIQPKRPVRRKKDNADPSLSHQNGHHTPAAAIAAAGDPGNPDAEDKDYVYDIYVRSTTHPSPSAPPSTSTTASSTSQEQTLVPLEADSTAPRSLLHNYTTLPQPSFTDPSDPSSIGYLILPPSEAEQSYFWTSTAPLGTDASSSSGADDDEDSNAEDYYGADYPEDEVDSEDEMDGGAYARFRRGSADEDEFADVGWAGRGRRGVGEDGAEAVWSDEDDDEEGLGVGSGARGSNPWRRYDWMTGGGRGGEDDEE